MGNSSPFDLWTLMIRTVPLSEERGFATLKSSPRSIIRRM